MSDIKPIQTEYKGYKFRSRLEARWAVFFDACGVDWEYEPEGYDLGDGIYYLPDFLIHGCWARRCHPIDLYVEVKGIMTNEDRQKIELFSGIKNEITKPILVVGNIPNGKDAIDMACQCFDKCNHSGDLYNFEYVDGDYFGAFLGIEFLGFPCLFSENELEFMDSYKTEKAYKLARQARFEHGENPF